MTATLPIATRRQPGLDRLDVNRDVAVSPIDALLVINHLNTIGSSRLGDVAGTSSYLDVNLDGFISPIDVLMIVNVLNSPTALHGEGESAVPGGVTDRRTHCPTPAPSVSMANAPRASSGQQAVR